MDNDKNKLCILINCNCYNEHRRSLGKASLGVSRGRWSQPAQRKHDKNIHKTHDTFLIYLLQKRRKIISAIKTV